MMMSKKTKRLYSRMQHGIEAKKSGVAVLGEIDWILLSIIMVRIYYNGTNFYLVVEKRKALEASGPNGLKKKNKK